MSGKTFWEGPFSQALSIYAIVIFALLWVGFVLALVVNPEWLDVLWDWVRALPPLTEAVVWVFFLPITVGLWIWQSPWTDLGRLLAGAGIVGWTLLAVRSFVRTFR
jgi:hypothetical protein